MTWVTIVRRGPLADPAFRKAMDMIIPRDVIREVVMSGFAENGGSVIAPANEFWHNSAVKSRPTNVKAAREVLAGRLQLGRRRQAALSRLDRAPSLIPALDRIHSNRLRSGPSRGLASDPHAFAG